MSKAPDSWEDEWSANVDDDAPATSSEATKKATVKASKAERRAQQAEFNRQLWAEAEGPRETNYFLESRNIVPLRSEFKPPPILLSRKGPIVHSQSPRALAGLQDLSLNDKKAGAESSEDEEEIKAREQTLAERQAQAARDREEKQRKYEERRQELFGTPSTGTGSNNSSSLHQVGYNRSGTSSPSSLTPPGSRSATPNRGRGGKGGRRGGGGGGGGAIGGAGPHNLNARTQSRGSQHRELYDASYGPKPDSAYLQRRTEDGVAANTAAGLVGGSRAPRAGSPMQPIRAPRGPDGSGRGGFGFAHPRPSSMAMQSGNQTGSNNTTSVASLPATGS